MTAERPARLRRWISGSRRDHELLVDAGAAFMAISPMFLWLRRTAATGLHVSFRLFASSGNIAFDPPKSEWVSVGFAIFVLAVIAVAAVAWRRWALVRLCGALAILSFLVLVARLIPLEGPVAAFGWAPGLGAYA